MIAEWPNKLGFDVDGAEVWKHKTSFRVFTDKHVLRVPYTVTINPATAVTLCDEYGLDRDALDDMEPWEAERLFQSHIPAQKELF